MHKVRLHFVAAMLGLALMATLASMPAVAQNPNPDITRGELRAFDQYLDKHPEVTEDLRRDPSLINNSAYLQKHPGLRDFLRDHPNTARELDETPGFFMQRERAYDRREGDRDSDITRTELRNFDRYLDSHPEVAKELEKNPRLADDPKYVAAHPGLKEWLEHHPNSREELRENPKAFMARERAYEKKENKKEKKKSDHDRDDFARTGRHHRN